MKLSLSKNTLVAASLLAVCFLTYANSLGNGFLLDDLTLILGSSFSPTFLQLIAPESHNAVYFRPLAHIFCAVAHDVFGSNPVGYHIVNLLIYFIACLSFYHVVLRLFNNSMLALAAALFLAVHPINGILVNYKIAGAFTLIITAINFALLRLMKDHPRAIDYVLSGLWFITALLCHETAAAFPFYLAAMLVIARQETIRGALFKPFPPSESCWAI